MKSHFLNAEILILTNFDNNPRGGVDSEVVDNTNK